jgi:hypothetical protein
MNELNGGEVELDRWVGVERRARERRLQVPTFSPNASDRCDPAVAQAQDRRKSDRRQIRLLCPGCGGPLEAEPVLSWIIPGAYSVDTGYCPACSRRYFRTRETGQYDLVCWPPLCPVCREPIGRGQASSKGDSVRYRCQTHVTEEWDYGMRTGRWTRPFKGPVVSSTE